MEGPDPLLAKEYKARRLGKEPASRERVAQAVPLSMRG